ncbi:uncharacterized protein (TIGR02171 family) [Fibrobacter sp. UWB6]|nr:uncharacterized protein (TIGR02171 family) [Fibrobacter sp. UWB6]
MMRIQPNGATVLLGDGRMRVNLDYDYSLGIHEVTCAEYKVVYKMEPDLFYSDCEQDYLPVSKVTYYDAVLFANAYGRIRGHDTVYVYRHPVFNSTGNCVNLEGLEVRTDVDGYRLPTEAEWMLAASQAWDVERCSWNASNSNFEPRLVCSFPDSIGFCDLAGNLLELTNDWLGDLVDTVVGNYVGAPTSNSLYEKVVKGGAMLQGSGDIKLSNRKDVYPVTASTNLPYMGFRLAFGKIPEAVWMDECGDVATSFIKLKAFYSDIREVIGVGRAKLAFRNDKTGNLAYVDYSNGARVVEFADSIPVYHPEISPDGMKVVFCTGVEGIDGESSVYVRNLDASGSGLVKLDAKNASIPRWYVDDKGDTSIVYVDNVGDNSDDAVFFARSTWMVPFANGKFGKPKKVLDGAYHSGFGRKGNFAVSGARKLRVYANGKDEIWYDGEQACNASLSKDSLNQVLFLDFGGATGRKFANEKYGVHERVLVADSTGKLVKAIPAPKGYSFDHSEWTGRENWAIASLVNSNGDHSKIVLVNVLDSSVVELAEGDEVWHPSLWVMSDEPFGDISLNVDSAGMYWDPVSQSGVRSAALKMRMFWDMHDSLEVIAVGSSRAERGFDPARISRPSLNFGFIGGDSWASLYLLDNYIVPHARALKYLIIEISFDLMKNAPITRMAKVFGLAPGYAYDKEHGFWKDSVPDAFLRMVDVNVCYSNEDSLNYVDSRGLLKIEANGWGEEPAILVDTMHKSGNVIYARSLDSLTAFIDSTQNKGFKIIGLIYPQSPEYAKTGSFGRHGVRRSVAIETAAYLDSLASVYPHFILMDENKFGAHDYTDAMANDYDHLSALGAEHLSARLDSLIKTLDR